MHHEHCFHDVLERTGSHFSCMACKQQVTVQPLPSAACTHACKGVCCLTCGLYFGPVPPAHGAPAARQDAAAEGPDNEVKRLQRALAAEKARADGAQARARRLEVELADEKALNGALAQAAREREQQRAAQDEDDCAALRAAADDARDDAAQVRRELTTAQCVIASLTVRAKDVSAAKAAQTPPATVRGVASVLLAFCEAVVQRALAAALMEEHKQPASVARAAMSAVVRKGDVPRMLLSALPMAVQQHAKTGALVSDALLQWSRGHYEAAVRASSVPVIVMDDVQTIPAIMLGGGAVIDKARMFTEAHFLDALSQHLKRAGVDAA